MFDRIANDAPVIGRFLRRRRIEINNISVFFQTADSLWSIAGAGEFLHKTPEHRPQCLFVFFGKINQNIIFHKNAPKINANDLREQTICIYYSMITIYYTKDRIRSENYFSVNFALSSVTVPF